METFKPLLSKISTGQSLTTSEAEHAFDLMLSGQPTPAQIGAFLMGLRVRGETVDEITGAVKAMRAKMLRVKAPADAMDIVGTGGDHSGSYNVSTLTALVVAAAGVPVAKHGNRAMSSRSGAADVLTALGVKVGIEPEGVSRCIERAGVGFMFAPTHHASMKNVGPIRVEIGSRTIFNLLGPLSNPAGVSRQLVGVYSPDWLVPMAEVLNALGSKRVWVVHGSDGLDEITTTGETSVASLENGTIKRFSISPEDAGISRANAESLKGGDAETNAEAIRAVLRGEKNAYRDIVVINAAAALIVAGKATTLREGAELAARAIDSGAAAETLSQLVQASNA